MGVSEFVISVVISVTYNEHDEGLSCQQNLLLVLNGILILRLLRELALMRLVCNAHLRVVT